MGLTDKVKAAAHAVSDTVKGAYHGGLDVVNGMMADISSASADLDRVGFAVTKIEVYVGLPPGLTVFLAKHRNATEEEFAAALANNADKLTVRTLLGLVHQADRWIAALPFAGRPCRLVAVELGIRPGVRLIYTHHDHAMTKLIQTEPLPAEITEENGAIENP
jgi:hypothetical protein